MLRKGKTNRLLWLDSLTERRMVVIYGQIGQFFQAKEALTEISRKYGIKVIFFDGRGGPPARGGGNMHDFYASLGSKIEDEEVQVTIQGQTISSNYGKVGSCRYNIEQLLSAGLENHLFADDNRILNETERELLDQLAETAYQLYKDF